MKKTPFSSILLLISFLFLTHHTRAQNWTGAVSADWNNAANWSSWPLTGEDLTIDPALYSGAGFHPEINSSSVFSPGNILIQNGATVVISANLNVQEDVEFLGNGTEITLLAGNVNVGPGNSGRLIAGAGASMNIAGGNLVVDQRFIIDGLADIIMNGGNVSSGQRVIVGLGGNFILNDGSINITEVLAVGDGDISRPSEFIQNGGSLSTGEIEMENETGVFTPRVIINGGTVNVTGDVVWFGAAPGAGSPEFILNGGITTIGGNILNLAGSTTNMKMIMNNSADILFGGNLVELIYSQDSIIMTGNPAFTISNAATWSNTGVVFSTGGSVNINGPVTLQGSGSYQFYDISSAAGAAINHFSPADIFIAGDLSLSGNLIPNLNSIHLNGSDLQVISGSPITFYSLEAVNSSIQGIVLNTGIIINNSLELTDGIIHSSPVSIVHLTDNAISSSGSADSYIEGPLKKTGNDAFVFPVGKEGRWRRVSVTAPASVSTEIVAEYFFDPYISLTPVLIPLLSVSPLEYWNLELTGSADMVNVGIYWEDASASAITDCNDISIAHWNGSAWEVVLSTPSGSCNANDPGILTSGNAINPDGIFTIGFFDEVYSQQFSICSGESVLVGNNIYSATGSYIDYLTASDNSDSTVITHLTVIEPQSITQNVEICYNETLQVGSNLYSASGTYVDTLIAITGCDSIITTNLTVNQAVDVTVSQVSVTLTATNTNATAYQWIDCDSSLPVPGEQSSSFTPLSNGNYAVIVTENNCSDTSVCVLVNSIGIEEKGATTFSVFPNPVQKGGSVYISGLQDEDLIVLYDPSGRVVVKRNADAHQLMLSLNLDSGLYILTINGVASKLLIN